MENKTKIFAISPVVNETVAVDVPDDTTVNDVIAQLLEARFLQPNPQGWVAVLKDGDATTNLDGNLTLAENHVGSNSTIAFIAGFPAGER